MPMPIRMELDYTEPDGTLRSVDVAADAAAPVWQILNGFNDLLAYAVQFDQAGQDHPALDLPRALLLAMAGDLNRVTAGFNLSPVDIG